MNREHARWALAFLFAPGAGPVLYKRCLEELGGVEGLASAGEADLAKIDRMTRAFVESWGDRQKFLDRAEEELRLAHAHGIDVVAFSDEAYPGILKTIYDPPAALFARGSLAAEGRRLAIVGSRRHSEYGGRTAAGFARDFARAGCVVVSGLARGIDSAAHRGALEAGATWAVLGGGILNPGSYTSHALAEKIARQGAVLSEFPLTEAPRPEHYPRRNRIVSGLSEAVIVIEAGRESGALITTGLALEQGRDVYAVPANVDSLYSEGSNWLLRQGAKPARSAADVLEDLGMSEGPARPAGKTERLSETEKSMIGPLSAREALHVDEWIEKSGRPPADAMAVIGSLVLKGVVAEKPGKYFVLEKH